MTWGGMLMAFVLVGLVGFGANVMQDMIAKTAAEKALMIDRQLADTISAKLAVWQDAAKLAAATPRAMLGPQIEKLQAIKREFDALQPPLCASKAKPLASAAMTATIDALLGFMARTNETPADSSDISDLMGTLDCVNQVGKKHKKQPQ